MAVSRLSPNPSPPPISAISRASRRPKPEPPDSAKQKPGQCQWAARCRAEGREHRREAWARASGEGCES
eukprot:824410-Rhodomonas_salina.2